jgi:uncharacterized protein (TIGR02453 family)
VAGGQESIVQFDPSLKSCTLIYLPAAKGEPMIVAKPVFTRETFQFFKDLARNNRKDWMDANRERYQATVVLPFRRLLEELSPAVIRLDIRLGTVGRGGAASFSRINRDIRFAKDKTPYRPHMYLNFAAPFAGAGETGELYVGLSASTATVGFRIYAGSKRKESALGQIAEPRVQADPRWPAKQKKRLGRKYESYWYHVEKGSWTEKKGWPVSAEEWKKLHGWIVRRKLQPTAATRAVFTADIAKIFQDVVPLLQFTSMPEAR